MFTAAVTFSLGLPMALDLYGGAAAHPLGAASIEAVSALARPLGDAGLLVRSHSHNDYRQKRPLLQALASRFYSVEADLWISGGEIKVSHYPWSYAGTLKELYLEPLQRLVDARGGSVHGDGRPFYLWLDLKEGGHELRAKLADLLDRYPMLGKAVQIVLTGDDEGKRRFIDENYGHHACRDSNSFSPNDPVNEAGAAGGWAWYALRWSSYFRWDGKGAMPDAERAKLRALVSQIHEKGRALRFYAAPDSELFWRVAVEEHVDLVGTDHVEGLGRFLVAASPREQPEMVPVSAETGLARTPATLPSPGL